MEGHSPVDLGLTAQLEPSVGLVGVLDGVCLPFGGIRPG